jgi:protein O-GlcNAc transferase
MSLATVESPAPKIPVLPSPSALLAVTQSCLATYAADPGNAAWWAEVRRVRQEVIRAIAALDPKTTRGPEVEAARALRQAFAESGFLDKGVTAGELAQADILAAQGWPGLLAALLLVPAWRWPEAPAFTAVPGWLWAEYAAAVFHAPQGFCELGDAEAYGAHYLRRLEELNRLLTTHRKSPDFLAALRHWLNTGNCIPLYFSPDSLRRHYELRGRLLTLSLGATDQPKFSAQPRAGRRLRIGFINRHFGPQTETYTTLPMFDKIYN